MLLLTSNMQVISVCFSSEERGTVILDILRDWGEILYSKIGQFNISDYQSLINSLKETEDYKSFKAKIEKEFFWRQGNYNTALEVIYNNGLKKIHNFKFSLSGEDLKQLGNCIDEILIKEIKMRYNIRPFFDFVTKKTTK